MFVREKIAESKACIKHIFGDNMLANSMTKGLPLGVFQNQTHMGFVKSFDDISI